MKWFRRFEVYRGMGRDRTIQRCFQMERSTTGRCPGRWFQEASRWRWKERAEAWDANQIDLVRKAEQNEIESRRRVWIQEAMSLQAIGIQGLSRLQDMLADPGSQTPLSPRDVLAFIEAGTRLEQLARGEATEINKTEHSGQVDWNLLWKPRPVHDHPSEVRLRQLEQEAEKKQKEKLHGIG